MGKNRPRRQAQNKGGTQCELEKMATILSCLFAVVENEFTSLLYLAGK